MKLKWYGTAALLVFDEQSVIAFDPFLGICHGDSHPERISMNGVGALMPVSDVFVTHGHFLVNGRKVNIPSFLVKPGMVITLRDKSKSLEKFKQSLEANAFRQPPKWLDFDRDNATAKVIGVPQKEDIDLPVEEHLIVELYSK